MGRLPLTMRDMQNTAAERGGKCLSKTYKGSYRHTGIRLLWECAEGHQWEAAPEQVRHGTWCHVCAKRKTADKRKLGINKMRRLAKERGGRCLSGKYLNNATKLRWECSRGHVWEATPGNVAAGCWCPFCAGTVKATLNDMKKIADNTDIHLAIITVPASEAQAVADKITDAGIKGIINFAPFRIKTAENIYVEHIDFSNVVEKVSYFARKSKV